MNYYIYRFYSSEKLLTHKPVKKKVTQNGDSAFSCRVDWRGRCVLSAKKISHIGCSGGRCRGHNNPPRLSFYPFSSLQLQWSYFARKSARLYEHSEDLAFGISIGSESSPSSAFLYDDPSIFRSHGTR